MSEYDFAAIEEMFARTKGLAAAERTEAIEGWSYAGTPSATLLRAMLDEHDADAGNRKDRPAPDGGASTEGDARLFAGRYRLVSKLGEGAYGEVWLAEERGHVRRRVAIKRLKPGMDSRRVLSRFKQEEQMLAMLNHPGIAKLIAAAADEHGRPFFVLEYVPNALTLVQFVRQRSLGLAERLGLFVRLCEAVGHAHQKTFIHRDLKPGNILVAEAEGDDGSDPQGKLLLKVIDFGIAKAMAGPLVPDATAVTDERTSEGTTGYRSPEQIDRRGEAIDTRSDVYSLGVILYELLVGVRPFGHAFDALDSRDQLAELRAHAAPDPSARFSGLEPPQQEAHAQSLGLSPQGVQRALRSELAWITLAALRTERERRYQSVGELAEDVRRYLSGFPVRAAPDSLRYRTRKLLARHRVAATGLAGGLALIVGAGWYVTASYLRERTLTQSLLTANGELKTANQAVESQRRRADLAKGFLLSSLIDAARPQNARGREITARDVLLAAARDIDTRAGEDAWLRAELHEMIGVALAEAGDRAEGISHLERAADAYRLLPGDHRLDLAETLWTMGHHYLRYSTPDELRQARARMAEAHALRSSVTGPDEPHTVQMAMDIEWADYIERGVGSMSPYDPNVVALALLFCNCDKKLDQAVVELNGLFAKLERLWAEGKREEAFGAGDEFIRCCKPADVPRFNERLPPVLVGVANHVADRPNLRNAAEAVMEFAVERARRGLDAHSPTLLDVRMRNAYFFVRLGRVEEAASRAAEFAPDFRAVFSTNQASLRELSQVEALIGMCKGEASGLELLSKGDRVALSVANAYLWRLALPATLRDRVGGADSVAAMLRSRPKLPSSVWNTLALYYVRAGQLEEAGLCIRKAVEETAPESEDAGSNAVVGALLAAARGDRAAAQQSLTALRGMKTTDEDTRALAAELAEKLATQKP